MKRKYAAIALGLTISMTALNVCGVLASDTESTEETTDDSEEETLEEDDTEIVEDVAGLVTAVGEDSLTIATGELVQYLYVEDSTEDDTEEGGLEDVEAEIVETESTETSEDEDSDESEDVYDYLEEVFLELDGQESTYTFDDTSFFIKETDDTIVIEVVEYSEEDTEASEDEEIVEYSEEETEEDTEDLEEIEDEEIEVEEVDDSDYDDTEVDEEITIEVIDLADIQVGDIVEIMVDSNNEATVILLQQANPTEDSADEETDGTEETTVSETEEE